MDRNNSRFTYVRRQGQGQQQISSMSSSSPPSISPNTNNQQQQHMENHRNSSLSSTTMTTPYAPSMSREPLTQHDELIRYIREAWTKVNEEGTPLVYRNESDHQLKNFKPFDLEEYWGQRLVQNIHVSHGHQ